MKVTKAIQSLRLGFCYNFKLNFRWRIRNPTVKLLIDSTKQDGSPESITKVIQQRTISYIKKYTKQHRHEAICMSWSVYKVPLSTDTGTFLVYTNIGKTDFLNYEQAN